MLNKFLPADNRERAGMLFAAPATFFLIAFFVIPAGVLFVISFWRAEAYVLVPDATIASYVEAISRPTAIRAFTNGLQIGLWTAVISTAISFPVAWYIVFRTRSNALLYIVLLSWFSSYLVRIFAWRTILGTNGLINSALTQLGLIERPLEFLVFSKVAVVIALIHIFLPFTLLLLLSALRNVTPDLIEAARDLGASKYEVFLKVVVPVAYNGFLGSLVFTFILALGDYVTPQLLGGTSGVTSGLLIANQFRQTGNWPAGAAMAFLLAAAILLIYGATTLIFRLFRLAPGVHFHPLDKGSDPAPHRPQATEG